MIIWFKNLDLTMLIDELFDCRNWMSWTLVLRRVCLNIMQSVKISSVNFFDSFRSDFTGFFYCWKSPYCHYWFQHMWMNPNSRDERLNNSSRLPTVHQWRWNRSCLGIFFHWLHSLAFEFGGFLIDHKL